MKYNQDRELSYVSPALACSTISWRRITSNDLGREPAGISLEVSCILTLCQSANLLSCRTNAHFVLFAHVAFIHITGCIQQQLFEYNQNQPMCACLKFLKTYTRNTHTNLSVFKLLFNILYDTSTFQALESPLEKLWSNLTCASDYSCN